jgi:hypothetical protein
MSARRATHGPLERPSSPTTPVTPTPVLTLNPSFYKYSATTPAVRRS